MGAFAMRTRFTELVGCEVPIQLASMPGIGTPEMVAAVSNAGGLGMIGVPMLSADVVSALLTYLGRRTTRPFGVKLLRADSDDTVLTEAFSVMWPNAPHRVLRSCVEAAQGLTEPTVGETDWGGQTMPIPRFAVVAPTAQTRGRVEAMALYAGESVGAVDRVQPAADIVHELDSGAQRLLDAWH